MDAQNILKIFVDGIGLKTLEVTVPLHDRRPGYCKEEYLAGDTT
jgi:hypothetical protein